MNITIYSNYGTVNFNYGICDKCRKEIKGGEVECLECEKIKNKEVKKGEVNNVGVNNVDDKNNSVKIDRVDNVGVKEVKNVEVKPDNNKPDEVKNEEVKNDNKLDELNKEVKDVEVKTDIKTESVKTELKDKDIKDKDVKDKDVKPSSSKSENVEEINISNLKANELKKVYDELDKDISFYTKYQSIYSSDPKFNFYGYIYYNEKQNDPEHAYNCIKFVYDKLQQGITTDISSEFVKLKFIEGCLKFNKPSEIYELINDKSIKSNLIYIYRAIYNLIRQQPEPENIKKYLELVPLDFNGWYYSGVINYQLGNFDEAINSLSRAIQLNPKEYNLFATLGQLYADKFDLISSITALKQARYLSPNNKITQEINMKIAQNYYTGGEKVRANEYINQVENKDNYLNALIKFSLGQYSTARKIFKKLKNIDSKMFYYYQFCKIFHNALDVKFVNFDLNNFTTPQFREGCAKTWDPSIITDFKKIKWDKDIKEDITVKEYDESQKRLISFGKMIKYNSKGNYDDYVMYVITAFGVYIVKNILDLDVCFRRILALRQIAEINDHVFCVSDMSKIQLDTAGYDAATPMISNGVNVYRYYSNATYLFPLFKKLYMSSEYNTRINIDVSGAEKVEDFKDKYGITQSFVVFNKLHLPRTNKDVKGVGLSYEVKEGKLSFNIILSNDKTRINDFMEEIKQIEINTVKDCFEVYFNYISCSMLSRGSALTSLIILFGLFARLGKKFTGKWKEDYQIDWQAFTCSNFDEFYEGIKWMEDEIVDYEFEELEVFKNYNKYTIRDVIKIING